jgi:hypothetical protein
MVIPNNEAMCALPKKKIIKTKKPWSTCHLRVAGSDGVNPGDLRGGGEA